MSPFIDVFEKEKRRLKSSNLSPSSQAPSGGTTTPDLYKQVIKTGNEDVQWRHQDALSTFHRFIKLLLIRLKPETTDKGTDRSMVLFSKGNKRVKL